MKDLQIQETNERLRKLAMRLGIDPDNIEEKTLQEINADLVRMNTEIKRQLKEME